MEDPHQEVESYPVEAFLEAQSCPEEEAFQVVPFREEEAFQVGVFPEEVPFPVVPFREEEAGCYCIAADHHPPDTATYFNSSPLKPSRER